MTLHDLMHPIDHATASIGERDVVTVALGRRGELAAGVITKKAAATLCRQLMHCLGIKEAPASAEVVPFPSHLSTPPRSSGGKRKVVEL